MAMDGEEHRYQRRIMQVGVSQAGAARLCRSDGAGDRPRARQWLPARARTTQRVFPLFKQLTLDLAASVFMGVELGRDATQLNRAFVDTVQASLALIRTPIPGLKMWRGVRGRERARRALPRAAARQACRRTAATSSASSVTPRARRARSSPTRRSSIT